MQQEPIHDRGLFDMMESCRPGSDDLSDCQMAPLVRALADDPALAERFQRQQRADAAMAAALRHVPAPEGLAERLLQRLAAARAEEASLATASRQQRPPGRAFTPRSRFSRRWLWLGAITVGAAAVLLAAVWLGTARRAAYTPLAVLEAATALFHDESPLPAKRLAEVSPPADYPLSLDVLAAAQVRWRPVQDFLGRAGVAYELASPGGARATLYVVWCIVPGLPAHPPAEPRPTTAGCCAAAWQEDHRLYVLVVQGGADAYRGYVRLPSGPLT